MPESDKDVERLSSERMLRAAERKSGSQGSETREVITQEDGTKIVRVRKRKRKSNVDSDSLTNSDDKLNMRLFLGIIISLVVLSIVGIGFLSFRVVSLNKPSEINRLTETANTTFVTDTEIKGYRLGYNKVKVSQFVIKENETSPIGYKLQINSIKAPIDPYQLFLGKLSGGLAQASSAVLEVSPNFINQPVFSNKWESSYSHDSLSIDSLDIILGESKKSKVAGANATFTKKDKSLIFTLREGALIGSGAFPSVLEKGRIHFDEDKISVESLVFNDGDSGKIALSGDIYNGKEQALDYKIEGLSLERMNNFLGEIISARINSDSGRAHFNFEEGTYTLSSDFRSSVRGVTLKRFLFLIDIKETFGMVDRAELSFLDEARGRLTISNDGYRLHDLNLYNAPNLRVQGEVNVDLKGKLSGQLSVGFSVSKITSAFPNIDRSKLSVIGGFVFIPATLSGTTNIPKDDFFTNLRKIVGEASR